MSEPSAPPAGPGLPAPAATLPVEAGRGHRMAAPAVLMSNEPELSSRRDTTVLTVAGRQAVLVELNLAAGAGLTAAADSFRELFQRVFPAGPDGPPVPERVSSYERCWLTSEEIKALLDADAGGTAEGGASAQRAIFRIWPDYVLTPHLDRSVRTVNADAASRVYGASGKGVVWAVIDSGIDRNHPHFAGATLTDPSVAPLHQDFTDLVRGAPPRPPPARSNLHRRRRRTP